MKTAMENRLYLMPFGESFAVKSVLQSWVSRHRIQRRRLMLSLLAALVLTFAAGGFTAFAQEQNGQPAPAAEQPAQPADTPAAPQAPAAQAPADVPAAQPPAADTPPPTAQDDVIPAQDDPLAAAQPAAPAGERTLPHNLSPWGMFMAADWVVKAVMIGLAFASVVTWTVWLAKSIELARAKQKLSRAIRMITEAASLGAAAKTMEKTGGPGGHLVHAAAHEMSQMAGVAGAASGIKERVTSHLSRIEARATRRMTRGTGVLATIGSTAPFVGLFGTVWGIMNSFIGISEAQTTNLAIVAPGIAEALLATAIGLVAAIPAVVIYNVFARSIAGYKLLLADASAAVERLVSRDLDRLAAGRDLRVAQAAE